MKTYTIDPLNKERPLMLVRGTRLPEIFPDYIAEHMANHINAGSRGLVVSINGDVRNLHGAYSTLISTRNDGDNTTSVVMFRESEILQDVEYEDKNGQQCKIVCDKGPKGPYSYGNCTYYTGQYKDLRNFIRDVIPYTGQPLHMDNYNQWYSLTTTDGVELTFRGVIQAQVSDGNYVGLSIDKIELGDTISIQDDLQITLNCDRPVLLGMVNDIGSKRPYDACISIGWLQIVVTEDFKSHLRELDDKSGNGDSEIGINDNYNGFTYNINLNGIFTDPNDFRMPNNSASCRVKVKEGSELCNSTIGDPVGYAIEYFKLYRTYQYSESEYYDISIAINGDPVTKDIGAYESRYIVIRLSNVQSNEELHIDFSGTVKEYGNITGIFVTMNARKVGQVLINSVNNVISIPEGNDMIALFRIDGNNEGGTMTVSRVSKQQVPGFYSADGTLLKAITKEEVEQNYTYDSCPSVTNESLNTATKFVCPEGVTTIGNYAFYGCSNLTSVTIPNTVTSIGENAFCNCSGLTSITIPKGVTSIGEYAFNQCRSLTAITIPEGVTTIGNYAFRYCSSLTSITIPEGVTSIGSTTFEGCFGLTSVEIPSTVTSIGESAFYNCTGLTSVTIPEGVTSIGEHAFYNCTVLTSVEIPSTVTSIGDFAFQDCRSLTSVTVPEGVTSIGESVFDGCTGLTSVTIPEGVTSIGEHAFYSCRSLTSVTIPSTVATIGNGAFANCSGLTSVSVPEGVTSIGNSVFESCSGLTSVTIPEGVTLIRAYAFANCSGLTSVTIPSTVTSIGNSAFDSCTGLNPLTVPNTVTSIGESAFYNVPKVIYSGSATGSPWGAKEVSLVPGFYSSDGNLLKAMTKEEVEQDYTDTNCPSATNESIKNATEFIWPEGVTTIGNYAFLECSGLTSVTIPEGVTSIGERAFTGCSGLTSVTIPEGVTSIGLGTFQGCSALTEVTIPSTVTRLESYVFRGCSSLTSVIIPEGVTIIGIRTFSGCTSLTSVTIPEGVTSIDASAFEGCTSLTSVEIPSTATLISSYVFENCTGLTSVTIPEGVTEIRQGSFKGCTSLTLVTIPSTVTEIESNAFAGCTMLNPLTVPNTVTAIGNGAFYNVPKVIYSGSATGSPWGALKVVVPGFYDADGTLLKAMTKEELETNYTNDNYPSKINTEIVNATEFVWPEGVTSIGERTFCDCTGLTSVTIPEGVTSIGAASFFKCSSLTSVAIPEGVTSIKPGAFYNCSGLTSVIIPNTVTSIEANAFAFCRGLNPLTIPNTVTAIGDNAFYNVPKVIYSGSATGSPWGASQVAAS